MRLGIDREGSWVLIHQSDAESCAQVWSLYGVDEFDHLLPRLWRDLTVRLSTRDSHLKECLEAGWAIRVIQLSHQVNALGGNPKDSQDWKLLEDIPEDYYQRYTSLREAYNDKSTTKEVGMKRGEIKITAIGYSNRQQSTLMSYDPATGDEQPYPSHAQQWRHYHGHSTAWLFNPWTGKRRSAEDVGSDLVGHLILPPGEPVCAERPPLFTTDAQYKDLLQQLGVNGHDGAVAEVKALRRRAGLEELAENKAELLAEDIECLHMCLDKVGVPRADAHNTVYSLWGRVLRFKQGSYPVLSAEVLG